MLFPEPLRGLARGQQRSCEWRPAQGDLARTLRGQREVVTALLAAGLITLEVVHGRAALLTAALAGTRGVYGVPSIDSERNGTIVS
jgi:hypothetical protein